MRSLDRVVIPTKIGVVVEALEKHSQPFSTSLKEIQLVRCESVEAPARVDIDTTYRCGGIQQSCCRSSGGLVASQRGFRQAKEPSAGST